MRLVDATRATLAATRRVFAKPPVYPKAIRNIVVIVEENTTFDALLGDLGYGPSGSEFRSSGERHPEPARARAAVRARRQPVCRHRCRGRPSSRRGGDRDRLHRARRCCWEGARAVRPPEPRRRTARRLCVPRARAPQRELPRLRRLRPRRGIRCRRRRVPARGSRTGDPRRPHRRAVSGPESADQRRAACCGVHSRLQHARRHVAGSAAHVHRPSGRGGGRARPRARSDRRVPESPAGMAQHRDLRGSGQCCRSRPRRRAPRVCTADFAVREARLRRSAAHVDRERPQDDRRDLRAGAALARRPAGDRSERPLHERRRRASLRRGPGGSRAAAGGSERNGEATSP